MFPKGKTYRSPAYLAFVRTLPCVVCGVKGTEAHHHGGGMGLKGSDLQTVSLCRVHHAEHHHFGKETFWKRHNLDRWRIIAETLEQYFKEKENEKKK